MRSEGIADQGRVVAYRDQEKLGSRLPLLFKIHGSAEPDYQDTTVFTLYGEGAMPEWKRRILRSMLRDRILLVVGYSGYDFEICPEILRIPKLRVIWNSRTPSFPSVNAEHILTEKNGVLLAGDLTRCFSRIFGVPFEAPTRTPHNSVSDSFRALFTESEIEYWRLEVLTSIGAAKLVTRELKSRYTNGSTPLQYRSIFSKNGGGFRKDSEASSEGSHLAQALFNVGRFKSSADLFLEVANDCLRRGDHVSAANIILDASDALRAFGDRRQSLAQIARATKLGGNAVRSRTLVKTLLIARDIKVEGRSDFSRWPFGFDINDDWIRNSLIEAGSESLRTGRWHDFQQVGSLAAELGIGDGEFAKFMAFEPPASNRGYAHLGFYLPLMRDFRASWHRGLLRTPSSVATEKTYQLAHDHLEVCKVFGLTPGIWKIHALFREEKRRKGIATASHDHRITSLYGMSEHTLARSRLQIRAFFLNDLLKARTIKPDLKEKQRLLLYARLGT